MKSELLKKIKADLTAAMKKEVWLRKEQETLEDDWAEVNDRKFFARTVISMFPSIGTKPNSATDADTEELIRKFINQQLERAVYENRLIGESDVNGLSPKELRALTQKTITEAGDSIKTNVIRMAESYMPEPATEDEILGWAATNIDFSKLKNKMQAMGPIMKHFGNRTNGNFVKGLFTTGKI